MSTSNVTGIEADPILICPLCQAALPDDAVALSTTTCPTCGEKIFVRGKLDGYVLTRLIGAGGMGGVYEALDEALDRKVAIKLILKEKAEKDPTFLEVFKKEAQAAAKLNHPNIVQVYAFGEYLKQPYIVMELVDCDSLDKLIERKGCKPDIISKLSQQMASALAAAAKNDLIHGDVKPENILINEEGDAKLADFGIAALASTGEPGTNSVWGTPYYIAPEILRRKPSSALSDMYSLGVTMYHALAGVPPFDGKSAVEVMKARLTQRPKPITTYCPNLNEALVEVYMKMIEPEPEKRYANFEELVKALEKADKKAFGKRIIIKTNKDVGMGPSGKITLPLNLGDNPHQTIKSTLPEEKSNVIGFVIAGIVAFFVLLGGGVAAVVMSQEKQPPASAQPPAVAVLEESPLQIERTQFTKTMRNQSERMRERATRIATDATSLKEMFPSIVREATTAVAVDLVEAIKLPKPSLPQFQLGVDLPKTVTFIDADKETTLPPVIQSAHKIFAAAYQLELGAMWLTQAADQIDAKAAAFEAGEAELEQFPKERTMIAKSLKALATHPVIKGQTKTFTSNIRLARNFAKIANKARQVLLTETAQRQAEAKRLADAERQRQEAERIAQDIQSEKDRVHMAYRAMHTDYIAMKFDDALKTFNARVKTFKHEEAKALAAYPRKQVAAMKTLKAFLIEQFNANLARNQGITAASETAITMRGKEMPWLELTSSPKGQGLIFMIIRNNILNESHRVKLTISQRNDLMEAGIVFCKTYISDQKNKTVDEVTQQLRDKFKERVPRRAENLTFVLQESAQ